MTLSRALTLLTLVCLLLALVVRASNKAATAPPPQDPPIIGCFGSNQHIENEGCSVGELPNQCTGWVSRDHTFTGSGTIGLQDVQRNCQGVRLSDEKEGG